MRRTETFLTFVVCICDGRETHNAASVTVAPYSLWHFAVPSYLIPPHLQLGELTPSSVVALSLLRVLETA